MNLNGHLDNKLQYDFLFHSLKGYKRKYQKWYNNKESVDSELIQEYYQCSPVKAKTILSVLTKEQIKYISNKLDKGGKITNNK